MHVIVYGLGNGTCTCQYAASTAISSSEPMRTIAYHTTLLQSDNEWRFVMTCERAREVLHLGEQWSNYSDHMTQKEIDYTRALWKTMPGYTCFYDAIVRIANGGKHGNDYY